MRTLTLKELQNMTEVEENLNWVPPWQEEALLRCFKFIALELDPFEKFNSDGGACILVKGAGKIGEVNIFPSTSFGVSRVGEASWESRPEWFQASETSIVLCLNFNIFNNVCFGMGCGSMHVRVREMITSHL